MRYDKASVDTGKQYIRRKGRGAGGAAIGGAGGLVVLLLGLFFGTDLSGVIDSGPAYSTGAAASEEFDFETCEESNYEQTECFMAFLMGDLNEIWEQKFAEYNLAYEPTYLNLFSGGVSTNGCGNASSGVGPFYCPAPQDRQVYIDPGFFRELATRFEAPGDFAQAYVVAHEVGHHISNISGDSERIRESQQQDPANKNQYSIQLELQADCYAGVWANSAAQRTTSSGQALIEPNDLEEGLAAAAAVGDDTIQEKMTGQVEPHTFTHGKADQRQTAFRQGFIGGQVESCTLETMAEITRLA